MSLIAASKVGSNAEVRARLEAAIRIAAAERIAWEGNAGRLAVRAQNDMPTVLEQFLQFVTTNQAIIDAACPSCGCAWQTTDGQSIDQSLRWLVGDKWATVGDRLYPPQGA